MTRLNPNDFKRTTIDIDEMLRRIGSGGAVLFVGSGYTHGALSVHDDKLPTASGLAEAIGNLGGFDSDNDLRYAAERFMREGDKSRLVDLLVQRFSVKSASEYHSEISAAGWRRIYTTNYDLMIERSAESRSLIIKPVDLEAAVRENAQNHNICVHLNGSIRSLNIDSLDANFKLTNSSYLSPVSFLTSPWHFIFKKDLELASAIIFVGYSLYDIEVQRILYETPEYKGKTYFITHDDESEKQKYTLGLFGHVLTIGAQGFGELLAKDLSKFKASAVDDVFSLVKYAPELASGPARDADVDQILMYGNISDKLIDTPPDKLGAPILINRDAMAEARQILAKKNLIVVSDFGNGKTMFLRMLKSALALNWGEVYSADARDPAQFGDLEVLVKRDTRACIVLDDYEQHIDLIKSFATLSPPNLRLIVSARTNTHERHRAELIEAGLKFSELAIDQLSNTEVDKLIVIFDNAGLWGELASLDHSRKAAEIAERHRGQISLTLLGVLESPQIRAKVSRILDPLLAVPAYKDTIFAISVLQSLASPLTASLISETALNNAIYQPEFRSDHSFRQMFRVDSGRIATKSSLFAISILRNQFSGPYIVDHLLSVISNFGGRDAAPEKERVFKELLRFSNVERLLPLDSTKKANLLRYYEELKRRADWLIKDPHFWLQYSMTQIQFGEYAKAQKFLDQAYSLAGAKYNYHTIHIDTQQARMWLEQSVSGVHSGNASAYLYFEKANVMLKGVPNDMHKFWQLSRYESVFDKQYDGFTKGQKSYFEQATKNAVHDIDRAISTNAIPLHNIGRAEAIKRSLELVIRKILMGRGAI